MNHLLLTVFSALIPGFISGLLFFTAPTVARANTPAAEEKAWTLLSKVPIQTGGRIKPLQTFAQDSILSIYERRSPRGELSAVPPLKVALMWLSDGATWSKKQLIYVGHNQARARLELDPARNLFSPLELTHSAATKRESDAIGEKQTNQEKLTSADQAVLRSLNNIGLFQSISTGTAWTMIPQGDTWLSLADEQANKTGIPQLIAAILDNLLPTAGDKANPEAALSAIEELMSIQAAALLSSQKNSTLGGGIPENPSTLTDLASAMNREVFYNSLRPFQKSWILYLISFLFLLTALGASTFKWAKPLKYAGIALFIGAFLMHSYGFVIRSLLTRRPPVTNMYESTIWVPWGMALFALIIAGFNSKQVRAVVVLAAAAALCALSLVLSDNVPAVLDPTIKPLEPVLRSNYWLTIHVLTITLSYGAFALSLAIGNVVLGFFWFKPKATEAIAQYSLFMYRAIQFGVVLLAAGTILGGVWADYSWGRFWGWDPKETWALIALLLYVAVLHGKYAGWVRSFGMAAWTVLCFNGVLMAWYGVNFVLGVGLHSYGFASGGLEYIGVFVALQVLYVAAVTIKVKRT